MGAIRIPHSAALARAARYDEDAARSEELRIGFAHECNESAELARQARVRNDIYGEAREMVKNRDTAVFLNSTVAHRDAALNAAFRIREGLGDFIRREAFAADYTVRYGAARSRYSTSATLAHLADDAQTLVSDEAVATWLTRYGPGVPISHTTSSVAAPPDVESPPVGSPAAPIARPRADTPTPSFGAAVAVGVTAFILAAIFGL